VINIEYWTSATDEGTVGSFMWCNGEASLDTKEANWKNGKPNNADGHCLFIEFSNLTADHSTVALGDCKQKKKFVCEVIQLLGKAAYTNL
jgi:Lectin C-type domain